MSKTVDEALAFVSHITQGKGQVHFEAILGQGQVPTPEDFAKRDVDVVERCQDFLQEIVECVSCLQALLDRSERQGYLPGLEPEGTKTDAPASTVDTDEELTRAPYHTSTPAPVFTPDGGPYTGEVFTGPKEPDRITYGEVPDEDIAALKRFVEAEDGPQAPTATATGLPAPEAPSGPPAPAKRPPGRPKGSGKPAKPAKAAKPVEPPKRVDTSPVLDRPFSTLGSSARSDARGAVPPPAPPLFGERIPRR